MRLDDVGSKNSPPGEEPEKKGQQEVTLFDKIDALFKGKHPTELDSIPNFYIIHRFLASDKDYALVVRNIGHKIRGDDILWQFWRAVVPRVSKSPYLKYPAPGKPGAATDLAQRLANRRAMSRLEAEQTIDLFDEMGKKQDLANYLGIELNEENDDS
jgi:hypothetical protein